MKRDAHLRAIHVVGHRTLGKGSVLVMLCSGPNCAGSEIFARPTAGDVAAEANAHVDKMAELGAEPVD